MKNTIPTLKSDANRQLSKLIENLTSWPWYYWVFYFSVIPGIILFIPQLPGLLIDAFHITPQTANEILNNTFVLNPKSPQLSSIFLMHYTHLELLHLCQNLLFFIIFVTIIFLLETDKKRFLYCSVFFLLLLPLVLSGIIIIFFNSFVNNIHSAKGFSGIVFAFAGYAIYVLIFPYLSHTITNLKDSYEKNDFPRFFPLLSVWIFVNIILAVAIMFTGYSLGQFSGEGNGIAHFGGYICGWGIPLFFDYKNRRELITEQMVIFIQILVAMNFYAAYLFVIHPGIG